MERITATPFCATCGYRISGAFLATGTFSSTIVLLHIELELPWSSCKEKRHSSFRRYCGLQIRQTTACGASCKRRCTKHASLISMTSNIASELSGPSWITPSLLQLCVSGVDVFQLVWRRVVVISSNAFNSDIWTVVGWYSGLIFLQLSGRSFNSQGKVLTLIRCMWRTFVVLVWFRIITLTTFRERITTIHLYLSKLYLKHYWFHFSGHGLVKHTHHLCKSTNHHWNENTRARARRHTT